MIYLDNGATTRMEEGAFEAMKPYLLDRSQAFGNLLHIRWDGVQQLGDQNDHGG